MKQIFSTTAAGATSGSLWGLLVGLIFLMPVVGVALEAASGALGGALTDFGINDKFMNDFAASLQPGNAALFLLIKKMTTARKSQDFLARSRLVDQAGTSRILTAAAPAIVMVASGENGMSSAARNSWAYPSVIRPSTATRSGS